MLTTNRLSYIALLILLNACSGSAKKKVQKVPVEVIFDIAEIKEHGELRALVDYSTTSYFLYRGKPMGFEYELLTKFCEAQELELSIIPITDLSSVMDSLNNFKGDLIAANLTKRSGG